MKSNRTTSPEKVTASPATKTGVVTPEAYLDEAKHEVKRVLLADHIVTIKTLRDEKRFTFREIAAWLAKRGLETDHSAVYRAYMAAIPEEQRHPEQDWSDVEEPGYGDEEALTKKDQNKK